MQNCRVRTSRMRYCSARISGMRNCKARYSILRNCRARISSLRNCRARNSDLRLLRLLLESGADWKIPNRDNYTALLAAAGVGALGSGNELPGGDEEAIESVQLLLDLGADINAVADQGETAMHEVVEAVSEKLELRLKHPQITALGTALHSFIRSNPKFVRLLVDGKPVAK